MTTLDLGLIAICAISGLLAMYRGLTREVLSILSWALAAVATLYFVLYHRDVAVGIADQYGQSKTVVQIALGVAIFIVVLLVVHFITVRISDGLLESRVGMIDRILGLAFGVVRGFLLVVIGYMLFAFFVDNKSMPDAVKNAASLPYIQSTGQTIMDMLVNVVPANFELPGSGGGTEEAPPAEDQNQDGQSG